MTEWLIDAHWITILAFMTALLCAVSFRKLPKLTRSSMLVTYQSGLIFIAPAAIAFAFIYGFFTSDPGVLSDVRQIYVRWALAYLFFAIIAWQIIIIRWGKTL